MTTEEIDKMAEELGMPCGGAEYTPATIEDALYSPAHEVYFTVDCIYGCVYMVASTWPPSAQADSFSISEVEL